MQILFQLFTSVILLCTDTEHMFYGHETLGLFQSTSTASWSRLPSEAGDAPSLAGLKARLDGAVSSLVSREVSLPAAGGWNEVISEAQIGRASCRERV